MAVSKPEPAVLIVAGPPVPWIEYHAVRETPTGWPLPHVLGKLCVFGSPASTK